MRMFYGTLLGFAVAMFFPEDRVGTILFLGLALAAIALFSSLQSLRRIADAQEKQADALDDIADSLNQTFFDDEERGPSDCARIVTALEKLAGIPPPPLKPPKEDVGKTA